MASWDATAAEPEDDLSRIQETSSAMMPAVEGYPLHQECQVTSVQAGTFTFSLSLGTCIRERDPYDRRDRPAQMASVMVGLVQT